MAGWNSKARLATIILWHSGPNGRFQIPFFGSSISFLGFEALPLQGTGTDRGQLSPLSFPTPRFPCLCPSPLSTPSSSFLPCPSSVFLVCKYISHQCYGFYNVFLHLNPTFFVTRLRVCVYKVNFWIKKFQLKFLLILITVSKIVESLWKTSLEGLRRNAFR